MRRGKGKEGMKLGKGEEGRGKGNGSSLFPFRAALLSLLPSPFTLPFFL